jgi:hypothetical protein
MIVADSQNTFEITGNGDVLAPDKGVVGMLAAVPLISVIDFFFFFSDWFRRFLCVVGCFGFN